VFLFVISGFFLLFGLMSFLAESLSNPVVLTGGDFDGQGGEKTQTGAKILDH